MDPMGYGRITENEKKKRWAIENHDEPRVNSMVKSVVSISIIEGENLRWN